MIATEEEEKQLAEGKVISPYRDKAFLFFFVMLFLSAAAFVPFFSAVPVYFRQDLLYNEAQIGALLAINGILITVIEMPVVYVLQERYSHLRIVAVGVGLVGLSYLIFNVFAGWIFAAILAVLAITIGEILNMPFANTWVMNRSNPGNRGEYMSLYGNAYSIAHVISPLVGLQIAEYFGFTVLWYILAVICVLSLIGMLALEKQTAYSSSS